MRASLRFAVALCALGMALPASGQQVNDAPAAPQAPEAQETPQPPQAPAQPAPPRGPLLPPQGGVNVLPSPILTIEQDRLFNDSAYGRRITAELEAEGQAITEESREIDAEMAAEEEALTERRPTLEPADFRALADAFNDKVQRLRREQDEKVRDLGRRVEDAQRQFFIVTRPVLGEIMRSAGAVAIVDRRSVLLSLSAIDVTDIAIQAIDAAIGDGAELSEVPGAERQAPPSRPLPVEGEAGQDSQ